MSSIKRLIASAAMAGMFAVGTSAAAEPESPAISADAIVAVPTRLLEISTRGARSWLANPAVIPLEAAAERWVPARTRWQLQERLQPNTRAPQLASDERDRSLMLSLALAF